MKDGWQARPLNEVCDVVKVQAQHAHLPYIGLEDVESGSGRLTGSRAPREVRSTTFRFDPGDVLYGRLRPYLNKVLVSDFEGHCSTEIFPLRPRPGLDSAWLRYWLCSDATVSAISATSTGARMPRANMNAVLKMAIPVPPLAEQERIVRILDEALDGIATAQAKTDANLANVGALYASELNQALGDREAWARSTIGEMFRFIDYRGKTPKKTQAGLRLITAKNVRKGYLSRVPEEWVDPMSYDAWMTRGIPVLGDVLFTTEAPLGNVAQLDTDERVVFAQRIIIMQPSRFSLDTTFSKYLLQSDRVQSRIQARATGATAQGIKASLLRTVEIEFPGLGEQRALASMLTDLGIESDRASDILRQKISALASLRSVILQRAFAGQL